MESAVTAKERREQTENIHMFLKVLEVERHPGEEVQRLPGEAKSHLKEQKQLKD